jgi:hypothetical protein
MMPNHDMSSPMGREATTALIRAADAQASAITAIIKRSGDDKVAVCQVPTDAGTSTCVVNSKGFLVYMGGPVHAASVDLGDGVHKTRLDMLPITTLTTLLGQVAKVDMVTLNRLPPLRAALAKAAVAAFGDHRSSRKPAP